MTNRRKSILLAAAPITALLVLAAGARFLPPLLRHETPSDEAALLSPLDSKARSPLGGKSRPKPAPFRPADKKTQAALKNVVSGQLEAFARNDFASALRYSGASFQKNFTPEAFQQMVETSYSGLLHSRTTHFETARCSADQAVMPVVIQAVSGMESSYLYILRRTPQKPENKASDWYVEGVAPMPPKGDAGKGSPGSPPLTDIRDV